jgi:hypothetical protein
VRESVVERGPAGPAHSSPGPCTAQLVRSPNWYPDLAPESLATRPPRHRGRVDQSRGPGHPNRRRATSSAPLIAGERCEPLALRRDVFAVGPRRRFASLSTSLLHDSPGSVDGLACLHSSGTGRSGGASSSSEASLGGLRIAHRPIQWRRAIEPAQIQDAHSFCASHGDGSGQTWCAIQRVARNRLRVRLASCFRRPGADARSSDAAGQPSARVGQFGGSSRPAADGVTMPRGTTAPTPMPELRRCFT